MILAMPIEAFSEVDLDRLEQSKIPEKTKKLDHLVPGRWQTALDLRRRPQMSQEIRSSAGPFLGPRNVREKYFLCINKRLESEFGAQPFHQFFY